MFVESADADRGLVVWLFTGASNRDADYQAYCDSIETLSAVEAGGTRVAVLIVDPGNPVPDARWRRRIAEVSRDVGGDTLFVLVGHALARGVATAINWIRRPAYAFETAPSFEAAVELARERAGASTEALRRLHSEARSAAEREARG